VTIRSLIVLLGAVAFVACNGTPESPTAPRAPNPFFTQTSARFTLRYTMLDASSMADIMATLDREHARITGDLGVTDMPPVTVNLYPAPESFRAAVLPIIGPIPSFANGAVAGMSAVHVVSPNVSSTWTYRAGLTAIVHEFAHCVTLRVNPAFGNNPRWLWETVALYEAGQFTEARAIVTLIERSPPTLAQLNSFDNTLIYDVGANLGDFMVRTWGRDTLIALVRANGNIGQVLGLTEAQFLTRWFDVIRTSEPRSATPAPRGAPGSNTR
jgi:hypothetical protein